MKLFVKVTPNAKQNQVVDDNIDLLGNRNLKVKVNHQPEDGKANKAVIEILAKYFEVKKGTVTISSGLTSRNKVIEIDSL